MLGFDPVSGLPISGLPAAGGSPSINATVGTWTWTGTTATSSQLINAIVGTWSWSGTTATTTQLIAASPGTWTWVGTAATLTQLINLVPGVWTWSGVDATIPAGPTLIDAAVGTFAWSGVDAVLQAGQLATALGGGPGFILWDIKPRRRREQVEETLLRVLADLHQLPPGARPKAAEIRQVRDDLELAQRLARVKSDRALAIEIAALEKRVEAYYKQLHMRQQYAAAFLLLLS